MEIINTSNINQARKQIDSLASKNKQIIITSQDDNFNKKILENKKINIFLINEEIEKKDYMKQRDSSLNEPLCKLAKKNNIKIAVDINKIIKKSDIEKAISLSRLRQNIMLCKKTKTDLVFLGDYNKKTLQSLLLSLKASTKQAKKAIEEGFLN